MIDFKKIGGVFILCLTLLMGYQELGEIIGGALTSTQGNSVIQSTSNGTIHFIDTGNSDAILIENNGYFAMIDTGNTDDDALVKQYLQDQGVTRLEYLILTHYHADHIGGADTVIKEFDVGMTLVPNGDASTKVYRQYIEALASKGLQPSVPREGATLSLGDATLTFYNTEGGNDNENNNSLVVLYEFGKDRALFTGDAEAEVEKTLSIGRVDLLKVGHHGSRTSSTESFIEQLTPEYAVILTGQPNPYGHPHEEVLNRLEAHQASIYRSDEDGDIIFKSTGNGFELLEDEAQLSLEAVRYQNTVLGQDIYVRGNSISMEHLSLVECFS